MDKLKQIVNDPNIPSDDDEQQLEDLNNIPDYVIVDNHEDVHNDDNDNGNDKQMNDKSNEFVKVDIEKYNFKPSNNKYPGLSDIRQASTLPTYEPIIPKPKVNDEEESRENGNNYNNLQYNGPSNNLYPSMQTLKPKTFTKYQPLDPKNIKPPPPQNDNEQQNVINKEQSNDEDCNQDIDAQKEDIPMTNKYANLQYNGPPLSDNNNNNKTDNNDNNPTLYSALKPMPKFTKYQPMDPKSIKSNATKNNINDNKGTNDETNIETMDEDDLLDDLDDIEVPMAMYQNSNQENKTNLNQNQNNSCQQSSQPNQINKQNNCKGYNKPLPVNPSKKKHAKGIITSNKHK